MLRQWKVEDILKICRIVINGFLILIFMVSRVHSQDESIYHELCKVLEIFADKNVQSSKDPIIQSILKRQDESIPAIKMILRNQEISGRIRAWAAFLPALMEESQGKSLISDLIQALSDPCWRVRINAANTLGTLKAKESVSPLLRQIGSQEMFVRGSFGNALYKTISAEQIELLEKELLQGDEECQKMLVSLAGQFNIEQNRNFLSKALQSPYTSVKSVAVYYLGYEKDKLWELLQNPSEEIKEKAVMVLGRDRLLDSVSRLDALMKVSSPRLKEACIWSLGNIGTSEAIQTIESFIHSQNLETMDIGTEIAAAATILGSEGRQDALKLVSKVVEAKHIPEYVKAQAVYGLCGLRTQEALAYLLDLSQNGSSLLKNAAKSVLWEIYSDNKAFARPNENSGLAVRHTWHTVFQSDSEKNMLLQNTIFMEFLYGYYQAKLLELGVRSSSEESLQPLTVYLFKDRKSFRNYAKNRDDEWSFLQDSGAYYVPSRQEMIVYAREDACKLMHTLFHETCHYFLIQRVPTIPIWINEGLAEFFSYNKENILGYDSGQISAKHIGVIRKILLDGTYTSVSSLIQLDHFGFHSDNFGPQELSHYAQSWSLVYFLYNANDGCYRSIPGQYLQNLNKGMNNEEAFLEALKKQQLDLHSLSKRWEAYFLMMPEISSQ